MYSFSLIDFIFKYQTLNTCIIGELQYMSTGRKLLVTFEIPCRSGPGCAGAKLSDSFDASVRQMWNCLTVWPLCACVNLCAARSGYDRRIYGIFPRMGEATESVRRQVSSCPVR